jgi:hypothetical protein
MAPPKKEPTKARATKERLCLFITKFTKKFRSRFQKTSYWDSIFKTMTQIEYHFVTDIFQKTPLAIPPNPLDTDASSWE